MGGDSEPRGATVLVGAHSSAASRADPATSPSTPAADSVAPGTAIGRYVVVAEAGKGGMGVVLRAYDPKLRREVAIKRLHLRGAASQAADGLARLLREARAMARLSHPNVLAVFDVEAIDGRAYVVMEYVEGRTLSQWSQERPRRWPEILAIFVAAARGLAAAHAVGLVHRDFKPSNVLVGVDERPRVTDFGLARATEDAEPQRVSAPEGIELVRDASDELLTSTDVVLGTPAYMAPEQHRGIAADATADQYAWCIALWEALFGKRPFSGELAVIAAAKRSGPPVVPPGVPRWLAGVITRGLAPDPAQRFATIADLLAAIEGAQARVRGHRVLVGVSAMAILVATVVGLRAMGVREQTAACERAGAEIAEVWNDDARARVQAAILGTGVAYAADTVARVGPWLDASVAQWQEARTEACLDANVRGIWNDDTTLRSLWCLEDRRMELEALVDELSRSSAGVVQSAVGAAAAPTSIASCRDASLLARLPIPPTEHREALQVVRRALSRVRALDNAGRYDEGLEVARAAVEQADAIGWPPISAAARVRLARMLDVNGSYADAEVVAADAYFEAANSGATAIAADAAEILVGVLGDALGRHDEALYWSRHAEVALASLGDSSALQMATHLGHLGVVHSARAEYGEAEAMHRRALEIRERELGPDHPWVGHSLHNIGAALSARGEFTEAKVLYERALANVEGALGSEHPDVATSINNIGSVHLAFGEHEQARALYERALGIRERVLGSDHPMVAQSLTNLAGPYHATGDTAKATAALQRALEIQKQRFGPDNRELGGTFVNLAVILREDGRFAEAKTANERALAIWERALGAEHPHLGYPLSGLADIALEQGRPDDARAFAERALAIREKAAARPTELATTQFLLARALGETDADRTRAIELATLARDSLREAGSGKAEQLKLVQAWLDERQAPTAARGR